MQPVSKECNSRWLKKNEKQKQQERKGKENGFKRAKKNKPHPCWNHRPNVGLCNRFLIWALQFSILMSSMSQPIASQIGASLAPKVPSHSWSCTQCHPKPRNGARHRQCWCHVWPQTAWRVTSQTAVYVLPITIIMLSIRLLHSHWREFFRARQILPQITLGRWTPLSSCHIPPVRQWCVWCWVTSKHGINDTAIFRLCASTLSHHRSHFDTISCKGSHILKPNVFWYIIFLPTRIPS